MSVRNILANAYFPLALLCACGGNSPSRSTTASPESTDAEPSRSDSDDGTLVRTKEGLVRGVVEGATLAWRAIPFAAPPVGDLRWRLPEPPARWSGERDASTFSAICPQDDRAGGVAGSEDCLYLNVYAPSSAREGDPLPVAYWIHGGGRTRGDGQMLPHALASHGLVVVTIQYRLGALGYLGDRALTDESGTSGNWGFFDTIAGLHWVRRNIERFGGDKDRVMIFGQSSGGSAVNALLASPAARGLFASAAIHSNALPPGRTKSLAESETTGPDLAAQLGCTGTDEEQIACLRGRPAADILGAQLAVPPLLFVIDDGVLVEGDVALTIKEEGAGVPLIIGSTREEDSRFLYSLRHITADQYAARVQADFPALAGRILPLYPTSDYDSPFWALVAVESDSDVTCNVRQLAQAASSAEDAKPVYRYLFTHSFEAGTFFPQFRAFHSADLPFIFGDFGVASPLVDYTPTAAELTLADQMQGYLARFAASGDPNGVGAVAWAPYTAQDDGFFQLDDTIAAGAGYHPAACDLFAPRY
jgi:para-nitrobenzyl esterase